MKSDVLTLISGSARNRSAAGSRTDQSAGLSRKNQNKALRPESIDELAIVVRDALNDRYLEVSKVRPFFWSMVETYSDRFKSYPFNTYKALFSDLELRDYPAEEMEMIVARLEQAYEKKYGKPMNRKKEVPSEYDSIDEEIQDLKDSLCYASLVSEEPID